MRNQQALSPLVNLVSADLGFQRIAHNAQSCAETDVVAPTNLYPLIIAGIEAQRSERPMLIVTATGRGADELASSLRAFIDPA